MGQHFIQNVPIEDCAKTQKIIKPDYDNSSSFCQIKFVHEYELNYLSKHNKLHVLQTAIYLSLCESIKTSL